MIKENISAFHKGYNERTQQIKFEQLIEDFKRLKSKQKGWIMMPDINGFTLYEINAERLQKYLAAESMYKSNQSKE